MGEFEMGQWKGLQAVTRESAQTGAAREWKRAGEEPAAVQGGLKRLSPL